MDELLPDKLSLNIGSYSGRTTLLEWDNTQKCIIYGESEYGYFSDDNSPQQIIPAEPDWKRFWIDLRNIGVWHWKEEYNNHTMLDGMHWKLEIDYGDKKLNSHGSNAYPPRETDIPSEAFKQMLRAFGVLMNNRDFVQTWYYNPWY